MNPVTSRDPLVRAAAAIQSSDGLATRPCDQCLAAGREMRPPDVYVARHVGGGPEAEGRCYVVYECTVCGKGDSFEIPQHLLLAADLRADAVARLDDDATPGLWYEDDGDSVAFYLDPADGRGPIKVAYGDASGPNIVRARAVFDYLAGGDARRRSSG